MNRPGQVLFIPHGGGPLPLLGDARHQQLVQFLQEMRGKLSRPRAIIVISAHWEASTLSITSAATPPLIYDYAGFPPESYQIRYPAPGLPGLAEELHEMFRAAGIDSRLDATRGFDHGLFVPLKLLYPEADIPCLQVSLVRGLDPETHLRIGAALATLMEDRVLILGSGYSFHNLPLLLRDHGDLEDPGNEAFENWLYQTCCDESLTSDQRRDDLLAWENAPYARYR